MGPAKGGSGYGKDTGKPAPVKVTTIYEDQGDDKDKTRKPGGGGSGNAKLMKLAQEVERMSEVFEEANRARAEERQLRDDMHEDLLRRIQLTRDYMKEETARLSDLMSNFTAKFEKELQEVKDDLMTRLNTKVAVVNQNLTTLESWSAELELSIEQERQDRLRDTEAVMAPIRKKVARLDEDLVREQDIRRNREEELMRDLLEASSSLNNTLDVDKFNREQYYRDLNAVTEEERRVLESRQVKVKAETDHGLEERREALNLETEHRIINQDSTVDNITVFIKRMQENITEEGKMG